MMMLQEVFSQSLLRKPENHPKEEMPLPHKRKKEETQQVWQADVN
jgi:hypothetical protein